VTLLPFAPTSPVWRQPQRSVCCADYCKSKGHWRFLEAFTEAAAKANTAFATIQNPDGSSTLPLGAGIAARSWDGKWQPVSVSLTAVPESEMVPVIVKELTGKTMDLQAPLSASITTLKQDICASNDLHPEPYKQKLLFRNAILEDGPHSLGE